MRPNGRMEYITNCVGSTGPLIRDMIDQSTDITRATFLKYVDRENLKEIEQGLGYEDHPSKGLTMAGDYHVSYAKSTYDGRPCVFFRWSAIEHIFI